MSLWSIEQWGWKERARVQVDLATNQGSERVILQLPPTKPFKEAFPLERLEGAGWDLGEGQPARIPTLLGPPNKGISVKNCKAAFSRRFEQSSLHGGQTSVARILDVYATFEGIVFAPTLGTSAVHQLGPLKEAYWPLFENTFGAAGAWFDTVVASSANSEAEDLDDQQSLAWELDYFLPRSTVRPGSGCMVTRGDPNAACNSLKANVMALPRLLYLVGFYGLNYFHFAGESGLPQLLAFRQAGLLSRTDENGQPWPILVYDRQFVRDALDLLGLTEPGRVITMEPDTVYFAHELYVLDGLSADPAPGVKLIAQGTFRAVRRFVQTLVPPLPQSSNSSVYRVLYVKRDPGSKRSVSNEGEVLEALREELPHARVDIFEASARKGGPSTNFTEQVQMFRRADLVLGVHGAAMTNLLWMAKGATAILFEPADAGDSQGGTLNDMELYGCGGSDFWLVAGAAGVQFHAMMVRGNHNSAVEVNVATLRQHLRSPSARAARKVEL